MIALVELIYCVQEAYYHQWEHEEQGTLNLKKKDVQLTELVLEKCQRVLQIQTEKIDTTHMLHVNVIWQLMEDGQQLVKDLSHMRISHNMKIEDENWTIDERLSSSTKTNLRGCTTYFTQPQFTPEPSSTSSFLRSNSYVGETHFTDFRDYCKGSLETEQLQVERMIQTMYKRSHFGSIDAVIRRNVKLGRQIGPDGQA